MDSLWKHVVAPGRSKRVDLDVPKIYGYGDLRLPVRLWRGVDEGPRLLVTAGIHGDEINGAEIARQLIQRVDPTRLKGQLVVMPMVNVYGLVNCSRYLPDRKDLNRSFPGSSEGSLASQLAHLVMQAGVLGASHLLDLHSASLNRANLPQLRASLEDEEVLACAVAFGVPVIIDGSEVQGSLRTAAREAGVKALLYEAGASARFNKEAIDTGVEGTLRLMRHLRMIDAQMGRPEEEPQVIRDSTWERAPAGGFFHATVNAGDTVEEGQELGFVCDCAGDNVQHLHAGCVGIVIGTTIDPRVNCGDAVVHIGKV